MSIVAFRSPAAPPRKTRLAIISTSSRLCGVAAYTDALAEQLRDLFEVTVFDLDQYLLRSPHPRVRKRGDRHIKEICRQLHRFDAVNLQLEHGTLGRQPRDIHQRFGWIVAASPRVSVTFHTFPPPAALDRVAVARAAVLLRWPTAVGLVLEHRRAGLLSYGIVRQLRRAQRRKPVTAIVHNRRDRLDLEHLYGVERVIDHPLAFMSPNAAEAVRGRFSRRAFPILEGLSQDAVLVGVFGFLNDYKGFGTAIRALHYLPDNHHLLVFGGIHPNEIAPRQAIHPYLSSLFEAAYMDTSLYQQMGGEGMPGITLAADRCLAELLGAHPRDLSDRIHFMGAPGDREFLAGMAACDAVVLPYLEVGQSASGPISQAVEMGCRVIASRTRTFLEFARYHPETIEFFDIGNYLELAHRILARRQYPARASLDFNIETNKAVYLRANSEPQGFDPLPESVAPAELAQGD